MENTIFYEIICATLLIILVLCVIGGIIHDYITRVSDILADNQQKLSRQIVRNNEHKENSKYLSSYERGRIDDIILALRTLGNEKLISYTEEINFLLKIRNW